MGWDEKRDAYRREQFRREYYRRQDYRREDYAREDARYHREEERRRQEELRQKLRAGDRDDALRRTNPQHATASPPQTAAPVGQIAINGVWLTGSQRRLLELIAQGRQQWFPTGQYWYDEKSGAFGEWGGPTMTWLAPGLSLAGPMPWNCSGPRTGVLVNGRDLHPQEAQHLAALVGGVWPGRYTLDGRGNLGPEGQPSVVNLWALMRARGIEL